VVGRFLSHFQKVIVLQNFEYRKTADAAETDTPGCQRNCIAPYPFLLSFSKSPPASSNYIAESVTSKKFL
jgi:hypothetical protein